MVEALPRAPDPEPDLVLVEVGPTASEAVAGFLKHELAEAGVPAWLRRADGRSRTAWVILVEDANADRAQALLEDQVEEQDHEVSGSRLDARHLKRYGASILAFMLCLRYGSRIFANPLLAVGVGVLLAGLCFALMGGDPPAGTPTLAE